MATETNEIILEINARYEDALNGIEQYRAEIERTKKDQETFYAEMKKGLITEKEYLAAESRSFLDRLFHGSVAGFATALCDSGIKREELEELRRLLEKGEL